MRSAFAALRSSRRAQNGSVWSCIFCAAAILSGVFDLQRVSSGAGDCKPGVQMRSKVLRSAASKFSVSSISGLANAGEAEPKQTINKRNRIDRRAGIMWVSIRADYTAASIRNRIFFQGTFGGVYRRTVAFRSVNCVSLRESQIHWRYRSSTCQAW